MALPRVFLHRWAINPHMMTNRNIKNKYPAETSSCQVQLIPSEGGDFNIACQDKKVNNKDFENMKGSEYGFRVGMINCTNALANLMINIVDYNCVSCQNLEQLQLFTLETKGLILY